MMIIELTRGFVTTVDDEDRDLNDFNWQAMLNTSGTHPYAVRTVSIEGKRIAIFLNRIILERKIGRKLDRSEIADHKNRNTLDNRRSNLRIANYSQNAMNRRIYANNKSGVAGVTWDKTEKRWVAHIRVNKKLKKLGRFETLEEARIARLAAEEFYFGEFRAEHIEESDK